MKLVKFHKFICKHDKSQKCKTDVYVNPEKVTWFEEVVDDGRRHACIYLEGEDFIDVFEQLDEVAKILNMSKDVVKDVVKDVIPFKDCEDLTMSDIKRIAKELTDKSKEEFKKKIEFLESKYGDIYEKCKDKQDKDCKEANNQDEDNSKCQAKDKKVKKVSRKRKPKVDRTETCKAVKEVQSIIEEDKGTALGQCS